MRKHILDPERLPDFTRETLRIDPLPRAQTIPSSWYVDPIFHDADRQAIFLRTWQGVGRADQVRSPGDYFLATVGENPIIVARGKDDVVRAFFNVCRHRGGPLATEDGNAGMLQCGYHGWTYRLDGALRGVPKFDRVELFDRSEFCLRTIHVEVWEGLVFVNLSPAPTPFAATVGGITERIAPISLASKRFHHRVEYEVACNWKVYVDNYLEGYHVPLVHPELFSMLDYNNYVTETYPSYSLQYSPINRDRSIYEGASGESEAYYYFIFPNFMLNILPGRLQTNRVIPIAADRCRVIFDYFYDDTTSEGRAAAIAEDIDYSDRVQAEDIEICEHVQRGLSSIAYDRGRFSVECEEGVYHFQTLLKEQYERAFPI